MREKEEKRERGEIDGGGEKKRGVIYQLYLVIGYHIKTSRQKMKDGRLKPLYSSTLSFFLLCVCARMCVRGHVSVCQPAT